MSRIFQSQSLQVLRETSETAVLSEGRDHLRGFPYRPRQVAPGNVAGRELQERHFAPGRFTALMGVTQKTAWFMLHRARLAMQDDRKGGKLSGEVEIDESYIGGKARNMHKSHKAKSSKARAAGWRERSAVQGILERGGTSALA